MKEAESNTTIDHDTIKKWVESRNGVPASVKGTEQSGEHAGLLRIHFPDYSTDEDLQKISWEEFFKKFDESGVAFLHQDETKEGKQSRFFKFVSRH